MTSHPVHGRWPWVAAAAAPASTLAWLAARDRMTPQQRWLSAGLPILFWHQFEEWVWPGGFVEWLNTDVFGSSQEFVPLDLPTAFAVNVGFGWGVSLAAAALGDRAPALPIALCLSHGGNAGLHLGWAARHRRWDPGAATAALLMTPWAAAGLRGRLGPSGAPPAQQVVGVLAGVASAAGLMATLRRRMRTARA